jgi:predicted metal-dependent peptidase
MGSIRRFDTKLLVAVDVSGSISSQDLSYFYGVINSAFRYGFTQVDVIQFDCGVRVVQSLKKVMRDVAVVGRGGTSFQEPIIYAHQNHYDGLVMLTDGYAPEPIIPDNMRCKIVWVCNSKSSYEHSHGWMERSGRVCTMELR